MVNSDSSGSVSVSYDPETGEYTATFDPAALDPSIAVVEATAAIREDDPERYAPLFEVVDPEALDRLCGGGDNDHHTVVEFTYLDHRVRVRSDGQISVSPISE